MFGIGLPELIVILIVALLVVGPSKLPEIARSLGKALGDFRRMADDMRETIEQDLYKEEEEKKGPKEKDEGAAKDPEAAGTGEPVASPTAPAGPTEPAEGNGSTAREGAGTDEKKSV